MWTFTEGMDIDPPRKKTSPEKRWILFVFAPLVWLAYMVFGVIFEADRGLSRTIDVIAGVALNILTFAWCRIDSEERDYRLHRFFPFATIIFGFLALLYYLFRSRGFRGGLASTGWFLLYGFCCVMAGTIVGIIILLALVMSGAVSADVFSE